KYFKVNATVNNSKTLVGTSGDHPNPLIVYDDLGKGYVMFMNVNTDAEWSNFYYSSSFPILWSQMIKYFNKPKDSEVVRNKLTGGYLQLPEAYWIQTPAEKVNAATVFLDKAGIYTVYRPGREDYFAVNLMDSIESNLSCVDIKDSVESEGFTVGKEDVEVKREHYFKALVLAVMLLILEVIMYRRRGLL
ncbi:MAG: hypothetical protein NTU61_00820, partial [Candidatus Altiarchaeota archaeon]|nr:hypothetical protein [Candidatus Altiarchaeota archaeon]